ncbi:hypothetical protein KDM89_15555 [Undibacterium sp. LFS511W]|uniref:Uncharacterized protein n=1 Tax=Undibacterium luofuense TaxID=2828733 RepID=A0A941DPI0_9BURK|nr:hypothetical protein [Undibacterium luofuense]
MKKKLSGAIPLAVIAAQSHFSVCILKFWRNFSVSGKFIFVVLRVFRHFAGSGSASTLRHLKKLL